MKQRDIFLASEGDAYFARNLGSLSGRDPEVDDLLRDLVQYVSVETRPQMRILEIGCGDGARLAWLQQHLGAHCHGIEPSAHAVTSARAKGLDVVQGSADHLPFEGARFDVVIFGFSLCWCDPEDLFTIASEAHRVLDAAGWLLIGDFFSPTPRARSYRYRAGVQTFKMDFRTLFTWHPDYTCASHRIVHHGGVVEGRSRYTDDPEEWVAISVLRKCRWTP